MSVLLSFAPIVTDFPWWGVVLIVAAVLLVLLAIFLPIGTYFMAAVSKAHVSMSRLVGMKMRRIKYKQLVDVYIRARKAGLNIDISELESHVMAGGNVSNVVNALISAHSANIQLSLQSAKAPTPTLVALSGIVIYSKKLHRSNCPLGISLTPSGISMRLILLFLTVQLIIFTQFSSPQCANTGVIIFCFSSSLLLLRMLFA